VLNSICFETCCNRVRTTALVWRGNNFEVDIALPRDHNLGMSIRADMQILYLVMKRIHVKPLYVFVLEQCGEESLRKHERLQSCCAIALLTFEAIDESEFMPLVQRSIPQYPSWLSEGRGVCNSL